MKLNTWYRVGYKDFYRYYFTQLDSGDYVGIEYNGNVKAIVAMDSWSGQDTEKEVNFLEPIFSREVYEKKLIDFAFLHGEIL